MGIKWLRVESWSKLLCISKVDVEAFDQRSRENSEEGRLGSSPSQVLGTGFREVSVTGFLPSWSS